MAAIASADPRYAPEDPSLPKPWKGLVDGKTGYLYYWNPETNITQYERPGGSAPIHKSSAGFVSSSVQKSSHGQHRDNDDVDRYGRGHRGSSKPSGGEDYQSERNNYDHSRGVSNMPLVGNGASAYKNSSSTVESDLSPDAYRRRHEISVTGDNVPPPLTSFNSTGFPSEILREGLLDHPCSWPGLLLVMIQFATWSEWKKRSPPALACSSMHWLPMYIKLGFQLLHQYRRSHGLLLFKGEIL
nr:ATP-dependent RNA helicase-like protein DB10 [Ipomoea batatas]GMD58093.1 ATP-dependent RNA helicase-like protein DB10 [Ipomoea batatas]